MPADARPELSRGEIALALAAALALQLLFFLRFMRQESMWPDEAFYLWIARELFGFGPVVRDALKDTQTEIPNLAIALVHAAVGDLVLAGRLTSLLWAIAGTLGAFQLGREVANARVGVFAALAFASAPLVLFSSVRVMADLPLCVVFLWTALFALRFERLADMRNGVGTALLLLACNLTKAIGVVMLLAWGLFVLVQHGRRLFTPALLARYAAVSAPAVLTCAILLLPRLGHFDPVIRGHSVTPPASYYLWIFPDIFGWGLTLLFPLGLLLAASARRSAGVALLAIVFLLHFGISAFLIGEKSERYVLPVLPSVCVIAGVCLDRLAAWRGHGPRVVLGIAFAVAAIGALRGQQLTQLGTQNYVGFQELAAWLREHYHEGDRVYVGSRRALRLYTGLEFEEYGGPLRALPERLKDLPADPGTIVMIDRWEYLAQPGWAFPFTLRKLHRIEALGLTPLQEVHKDVAGEPSLVAMVFGNLAARDEPPAQVSR